MEDDLEARIAALEDRHQDELLQWWARLHDELNDELDALRARLRG